MWLDDFSPMVDTELRRVKAPGCSIAVVGGQGEIEARGFGLADLRSRRPAASTTLYHLFSVTKLLTATRVMQLVEAGDLCLDTPIAELVPAAPKGVTVENLLSHTSGLRDKTKAFLAFHLDPADRPATDRALAKFSLKLRGQPGAKASYQNVNYMLLGSAIEAVTGRSFEEDLLEHVLQPIGMGGKLSALYPHAAGDAATGYLTRWDMTGLLIRALVPGAGALVGERIGSFVELAPYDLDCTPIGGLAASVEDAARFVQDQLGPRSRLLSVESRDRMRQVVGRGKAGLVSAVGTGLGWKIGESSQGRYLNHEGGGLGFTAELRLYPKHGIGMVMVMNRMAMSCSRAAHRICEAILERRPFS